jgi:ribonuclease III
VANDPQYAALEDAIGYEFRDSKMLATALTHRSYANENPDLDHADNEKLEFLGDAVLDLVVGHILMGRYPELSEGDLSVRRAQMVSEQGLAPVAAEIDLGAWLHLGKGEAKSGGRNKASILADAFEALVAAVYLDGGFGASWDMITKLFFERLWSATEADLDDYKTQLQERAQAQLKATPVYAVVAESGPDHDKTFKVAVKILDREWAQATGKSKKEAEQRAAESALSEFAAAFTAAEPA